LKSFNAKLIAIRRVTQDNQGKKTAGVDGVKSLTPEQRLILTITLGKGHKAKPLRRVWIPKPGKDEKRPLGIPTIRDRAEQALVKLALEPQWEARFEGTSYGFRPGRSTHDAIGRIFPAIKQGNYYVLDADISKCFDKINHAQLLSKLDAPKRIRDQVRQWLKAGVMDNDVFEQTESGTPQGGVISPLLANIALDGLARYIGKMFTDYKGKTTLIRYADDFVVISKKREDIEQCQIAIAQWLKGMGLELNPTKTRICHTLNHIEVNGEMVKPGFDFLGFNIRQYPVGKYKSGRFGGPGGRLLGFKTIIKPSKKAIKAHTEKIKGVIKSHKTAPQYALIRRLNPIIRGWSNYYSGAVSKATFSGCDYITWSQLRAWTVSRCHRAGSKLFKYFSQGIVKLPNGKVRKERWLFKDKEGHILYKHNWTQIVRHKLVNAEASPYDGNWTYWATRRGAELTTPTRVAKLLKRQNGKCNHCGQYFTPDDLIEVDHIQPRCLGGKNEYNNLQLLHKHCHDVKTSKD
jgi:RNA-directed DNA polymerase